MAERYTPISKARAKLPRLSKTAQDRQDRHIITQKGQPQSVLLGYEDYKTMRAAVELLRRPDVIEDVGTGLKELKQGKRYTFDEARKMIRERRAQEETTELVEKVAADTGLDVEAAGSVVGTVFEMFKAHSGKTGQISIPGVGKFKFIANAGGTAKVKPKSKAAQSTAIAEARALARLLSSRVKEF